MKKILIVEDETMVAMMIEDMVDSLGYQVVGPAANLNEAFDLVNGEDIDAALLDVNLGNGERAYPIADALFERHIPFAFASGYAGNSMEPRFDSVTKLQKPFDMFALKRVLTSLIAA